MPPQVSSVSSVEVSPKSQAKRTRNSRSKSIKASADTDTTLPDPTTVVKPKAPTARAKKASGKKTKTEQAGSGIPEEVTPAPEVATPKADEPEEKMRSPAYCPCPVAQVAGLVCEREAPIVESPLGGPWYTLCDDCNPE